MSDPTPPQAPFKDDDLVYVDPENRTVIGPVEWSRAGNPKPKPKLMPEAEGERTRGPRRKHYYPWGTYKSMKRVYQLEGKPKKVEGNMPLDDAMQRAAKEAFWD
ncbi:MAG: hypothetical protein AAB728_05035 [Patescibacteria group bacterium]